MPIKYALYENNLTSDPDDYMAVVQNQTSRSKEELIDEMIGRGSTVTKAEALSVLEEFEAAVQRALENGDGINTPLFKIAASVQGVFLENESYDKSKHLLKLNVSPGSRISEIASGIKLEKVEATTPQPIPASFKDVLSETVNETATPGGVAELNGSRLKIDTEETDQGIYFMAADGSESKVTTLIRNKPSNLIFMIPGDLTSGEYRLEVRNVPHGNKNIRTGSLGTSLTVV